MIPNRNKILDGLLTVLRNGTQGKFKIYSRKLKLWDAIPPTSKPALYLTDHTDSYTRTGRGLPAKVIIDCRLFLYAYADVADDKAIGSVIINDLVDAVERALTPGPGMEVQNLGFPGEVDHCWIEGESLKEPGDVDGDALALVPIKILVPTLR
jgi:hypothetical protein